MSDEETRGNFITQAKDALGALREMVLIAILLLLLFFPTAINSVLENAGFVKASIAGFEWQSEYDEAQQQTGEAAQQIESLTKWIDSVKTQLSALSGSVTGEQAKKDVDKLSAGLDSSLVVARSAGTKLYSSLDVQQSIIREARVPPQASEGTWAIVTSGDRTFPEALHEVRRARSESFEMVAVYNKRGSFRTVILFGDRERAVSSLESIQKNLSKSAYIVNMDEWCPNPKKGPHPDEFICQ